MAAIFSAMKEVFERIGKKGGIKGSYINPTLRGKGVKEDEIKWADLAIDDDKFYKKEELLKLEKGRKDVHSIVEANDQYRNISIHSPEQGHTYKARVYKFRQKGIDPNKPQFSKEKGDAIFKTSEALEKLDEFSEGTSTDNAYKILLEQFDEGTVARIFDELNEGTHPTNIVAQMHRLAKGQSRYNAPHFSSEDNYLMHARSFDDTFDGTPTRVLQEIQSDLHQKGRQSGYKGEIKKATLNGVPVNEEQVEWLGTFINRWEAAGDNTADLQVDYDGFLERTGLPSMSADELQDDIASVLDSTAPPISPFEKTWARKTIEKELVQALNDGRQQLAIPISGREVDDKLARGTGVKDWYKKAVVPQMRKIARASGSDFEMKEVPSRTPQPLLKTPKQVTDMHRMVNNIADLWGPESRPFKDMVEELKKNNLFKDNKTAINHIEKYKQGLISTVELLNGLTAITTRPKTKYAIIKPKKGKDIRFSLYSSPGAAAVALYQAKDAHEQLRKEGKDEGFIKDFEEKQASVKRLLDAGLTMEEIKKHVGI